MSQHRSFRRTASPAVAFALLLGAAPAAAQEPAPADAAPAITLSATPGKGVTIEREGDFSLRIRGRIQLLEQIDSSGGEVETEASVRSARLVLGGFLFDEDVRYGLELAFAGRELDDRGSPVLEATLEYTRLRDLSLRVGLDKVPFDRQRLASAGSLQLVDRSPVVGQFVVDYDLGLILFSEDLFGLDERFAYWIGLFNGEGRGRLSAPAGALAAARFEVRPFGGFDAYVEGDLERSARPRLALAGSVAWNENAVRTLGNRGDPVEAPEGIAFEGFDYLHLEADAVFKWNGLSLLGEFAWRDSRGDVSRYVSGPGAAVLPRNGWGWFVQAGQMLGARWEVAFRYGEQHALDGSDPEFVAAIAESGRELGGGVNWYVRGHTLKLQGDWFRTWGSGGGARPIADGDDRVRLQITAAF